MQGKSIVVSRSSVKRRLRRAYIKDIEEACSIKAQLSLDHRIAVGLAGFLESGHQTTGDSHPITNFQCRALALGIVEGSLRSGVTRAIDHVFYQINLLAFSYL